MPLKQTPTPKHDSAKSKPKGRDSKITVGGNTTQARRKTIDRRDSDDSSEASQNERRSQGNRRNLPESGASKSTKTQRQRELDLRHQKNEMRVQQHRKKKLLAGCEPVMGLNYDTLAMDNYPANVLVAAAKRDRDYWLVMSSVFGSIFLLGFLGLTPAWVAGIGIGLFFVSLAFAFTSMRTRFFARPPLSELLQIRKSIEFRALNHIRFLEGADGLAWRCSKLAKYNNNLKRRLFEGVFNYSEQRKLFNVIKNKRHIRLYLILMIESQKAYKRVQKDYLESHFNNLDQGWDDTVSDAEADKLQKQLLRDAEKESIE